MITRVINLFGAPGTGKSTLAAGLVHQLKLDGHEAILIPELFKQLALGNVLPTYNREVIMLGKQIDAETSYYGLARFLVAECPLELNAFYTDFGDQHFPTFDRLAPATEIVKKLRVTNLGVVTENFVLTHGHFAYSSEGRYHTEASSKGVADNLLRYLSANSIHYRIVNPDACFLKRVIYGQAT